MEFLMECLDTINSLKINFKRNIGTVIIIVEGEKDEFNILKRIFRDILHYRYIEKKRNKRIKELKIMMNLLCKEMKIPKL